MVFVSQNRARVHHDRCSDVRGRDETLSFGDAEAHSFSQDDGEEVSDSIGVGSGEHEEGGEAPYFKVEGVGEVGGD